MEVDYAEPVMGASDHELRLGASSWDASDRSVKYVAGRDMLGRVKRPGEFPVGALVQAMNMAHREGEKLDLSNLDPGLIADAVEQLGQRLARVRGEREVPAP